ncbi:MAG: hypothetical protein MUF79_04240 [Burkholderiales bacterium]|jgi:hypothetical protein|nr:hypothetical protein [Burkholderiales bacterium]
MRLRSFLARDERPISDVPKWVIAALALGLAAQLVVAALRPAPRASAEDLPVPPSSALIRLAALGEPVTAAKLLMLYLQSFDYRAGTRVPYRDLDYARVVTWLDRIVDLDPTAQYPLMTASRIYAEVPDPEKQRQMLDFVYRRYLEDPNRRWPWLAHAAYLAKHRLRDLPLARRYAVALEKNTTTPEAPLWVRQMEFFVLEDMNELEAAKILLGGLIASGQIKDARELAMMENRLKGLEERIEAERKRGK